MSMITRDSVILIDQIEQDLERGMLAQTAIVEVAVRRFKPIILTAVAVAVAAAAAAAAVLAMIPLSRIFF